MLKIFALSLLLFPLAAVPAAAQAAPSVVMVVDEYDNEVRFGLALWHAVQLKKAGIGVSLVFEGEAVLNFLPEKTGRLVKKSPNADRLALPLNKGKNKGALGPARLAELLAELKRLNVPMTACAFSAVYFGEYEALKAAGAPLSADPERPVDVAALLKGDAQLLVF